MPFSILPGPRIRVRAAAAAFTVFAVLASALPAEAGEAGPPVVEQPSPSATAAPEATVPPGPVPTPSPSAPEAPAAASPSATAAPSPVSEDPGAFSVSSATPAPTPAETAPAPAPTETAPSPSAPSASKPDEPAYITAGRKAIAAKATALKLVAAGNLKCALPQQGCARTYTSRSSSKTMRIYWTAATGAHAVHRSHAVGRKYGAADTVYGKLGYPTSEMKTGIKANGAIQSFQKGQIAYSPASGAQTLTGQVLAEWTKRGGRNGTLGYPLQYAKSRDGKTTQVFQGGSLIARKSGAAYYPKNECWALGAGKTRYQHGYASRVSFAIAEKYGTHKADFINCRRIGSVYVQAWETPTATVGLKGFKKPGVPSGHTANRWSPQGSYSVTEAFGEGNPGTGLGYRTLNPRSRWSGTPGSSYNKYYDAASPFFERWPDENLWNIMRGGDYRQAVVINYNRGPGQKIRQGQGFAIFLHAKPVPTFGCIALDLKNVTKYLKTAQKGDLVIMGVRKDIFKA
ncbi:hypothetical protein LVY72_02410 [Arthrobacter sp. I2-34]|uniref:LGFP repeat-containing protein n=1 Tax=Arthrobacter hankyongi TaxID=2904801 RepID=A0ABS9L278_9MICC|nr:hypothetical protein [Arthrobacter hankyongi]MCG2620761.1 hypothetical protein [Arthrobacter hankyongi]